MAGNDPFTKVLLHFNGSDGSTTITDSNIGGSAHTWTAVGNAQIDTAISKFGGAAGLFDGTGDYVDTPDHADFSLGSGDWTIDFQFNRNGNSGAKAIAGQAASTTSAANSAWQLGFDSSNRIFARVADGSTFTTVTGTTSVTGSAWHHFYFARSGNTINLFLDGVLEATSGFTGTVTNSAANLAVGRTGQSGETLYTGSIDEFRISVGIARATTVPTAAYDEFGDGAGAASGAGASSGVGGSTVASVAAAAGVGAAAADSTGSGVNEGIGTAPGTGDAHGAALDLPDVVGSCAAYYVRGHLGASYTVTGEARV